MNLFDVLGDPVRRRIVELLASGERPAGQVAAAVMEEFGIGQPAVSNQLRVLREAEVVAVEPRGSQRIYRLRPDAFTDLAAWLQRYTTLWPQRLDALETELARGRRSGRARPAATTPDPEEQSWTPRSSGL